MKASCDQQSLETLQRSNISERDLFHCFFFYSRGDTTMCDVFTMQIQRIELVQLPVQGYFTSMIKMT